MPAQHLWLLVTGGQEVPGTLQDVWGVPGFRAAWPTCSRAQAGCSSLLSATRLPLLGSGWGGDEKEVNDFPYLQQVNDPRK